MKKLIIVLLVAAVLLPLFAEGSKESASGEFTPSKDISWIVTSKPGGGSDIYTRTISGLMTEMGLVNGKNFIIENKTDGGGEVGRYYVQTVKGDNANHQLLTFNSGDLEPMIQNTDNRLAGYKPICVMAADKHLIFTTKQSKYQNFNEVIDAIKRGERVVIAGSRGDDESVLYAVMAEIGATEDLFAYINEDSSAVAITDLLGGHVDVAISKPAAAAQYVQAGEIQPILAMSTERYTVDYLKDAPTLSELGPYKDVEIPIWRGAVGPAAMSDAAVEFWSGVFKAVFDSEAFQTGYIQKNGLVPMYKDYKEAAAFMAEAEQTYLKKYNKSK
ncbi:MAG: tripartite tricarboxylate transporter substrate binding protein [Spirochaetales bacterium]|nr:tripartite tricarboxylate transporter substrate binding protein [Spirochaetales bacterium]